MNPDQIMESLVNELNHSLKSLSKAKTIEEKMSYSQIVKNLSESLGVFFNLASDMMLGDMDEDED